MTFSQKCTRCGKEILADTAILLELLEKGNLDGSGMCCEKCSENYKKSKRRSKMQWLTIEQVKDRFQIKDTRTITVKFAKMGLKFIKIGNKYRFDLKDIEEFEEKLKEEQQKKLIEIYPIKRKSKSKTINVDYEKIRANKILNRVI